MTFHQNELACCIILFFTLIFGVSLNSAVFRLIKEIKAFSSINHQSLDSATPVRLVTSLLLILLNNCQKNKQRKLLLLSAY